MRVCSACCATIGTQCNCTVSQSYIYYLLQYVRPQYVHRIKLYLQAMRFISLQLYLLRGGWCVVTVYTAVLCTESELVRSRSTLRGRVSKLERYPGTVTRQRPVVWYSSSLYTHNTIQLYVPVAHASRACRPLALPCDELLIDLMI